VANRNAVARRLALVELHLLDNPALRVATEIAFAPDITLTLGNLVGLDVLEHFDFGLTHAGRIGYLSRRT
jgi:hypothetical protein